MTTQTIASLTAYMQQRPCAKPCFWTGEPNNARAQDVLGLKLGCDSKRVSDMCFCRPDLSSLAVDWLSSCVLKQCSSNTLDFSSAVGIYDEYCTDKQAATAEAPAEGTATQEDMVTATNGVANTGTPERTRESLSTATVTVTASETTGSPKTGKLWLMYGLVLLAVACI